MEAEYKLVRSYSRFDVVELDGGKCAVAVKRGQTTIALLVPRNAACDTVEALAAKLDEEIRAVIER